MIELAARTLVDLGMPRGKALGVVFGVGFALGVPSALYLDVLSNQDFVWGVALMISGLFVALVTMAAGPGTFRQQFADDPADWDPGAVWVVAIRFVVPALAVLLLGWWLYLSATAYAPDTWWDPLDPFSVATCVMQWGIAIVGLVAANRWVVAKLGYDEEA